MTPDAVARRAIPLLDLTDLTEDATAPATDALCARARHPAGPVAAICVWPRHVARAARALSGTPVRIATVANFPAGGEDVEAAVAAARASVADGAHEVDVVLPYRALARGDEAAARGLLDAVRAATQGRLLKVILETGELAEPDLVRGASRLALAAGADFLKTSTGKTGVSATLEAATIMLETIRDAGPGRVVGLKPSGGIRTVADAAGYLALADRVMGPGWVSPKTFRIGASGLLDALDAAL